MVNFTIGQVHALMSKQSNIRNVAVIHHAPVNQRASDLAYSLVLSLAKNFIIAGSLVHYEPVGCGESRITIKSTRWSLYYEIPDKGLTQFTQERDGNGFLIHVILSSDSVHCYNGVSNSLSVIDGAVIIVDYNTDVCCQTIANLRQIITERVKPIIFLSGVERALIELHDKQEDLYQMFRRIVENANVIVGTYTEKDGPMGPIKIDPVEGTVVFGSCRQEWAFTVQLFAEFYAEKFRIEVPKLTERLWGNHFYDPKERKWTKTALDGSVRGFCQFILDPIMKVFDAVMNFKQEETDKLLEKLNVELSTREKQLTGVSLLKAVMQKWLPVSDSLLRMVTVHLPSPITAQKYRMEVLYDGPQNDICALGIKNCDPKAPLMMCVSKMIPTNDGSRLYSFGRVFSGVVSTGDKVRIMGPNYVSGKKEELHVKPLEGMVFLMGRYVEPIQDVPCGNVIGLVGVDQFLVSTGTISTYKHAHTIKVMKTKVSPVMHVSVEAKYPRELPTLVRQLKCLSQCDPLVQCTVNNSGEHIVAGVSEIHLKQRFSWEENYITVEVKKSDPVVSYRETVSEESSQMCVSKSPNKQNRLFMKACALPSGLSEDIIEGKVTSGQEPSERAHYLVDKYKYDDSQAQRIWCFGPEGTGPNLLIDCTKGVQSLDEIKDAVVAGFQWATKEGVLCEENVHGVQFNMHSVTLLGESTQRSAQIIPTTRRVLHASMLTANPRLLEPIYLIEILCEEQDLNGIYRIINSRQGQVLQVNPILGTLTFVVTAHLPVRESFGFTIDIDSNTNSQAFICCVADHWSIINDDPFNATSKSAGIIAEVRKHKGLKDKIPDISNFLDN